MTMPSHPDCRHLLAVAVAADPAVADLVDRFPAAADPRHLTATLALWQAIAEHAPAASLLADAWVTADAGRDGQHVDTVAISIDHPDRTQPVQLVRYLDRRHLTTTPTAVGPAGAAGSVAVLAAAFADLERAAAALTEADLDTLAPRPATRATHLQPVRSPR